MSCEKCNKPCIVSDRKCLIAEMRILYDISFKEAWERITGLSYEPNQQTIYHPPLTEIKYKDLGFGI